VPRKYKDQYVQAVIADQLLLTITKIVRYITDQNAINVFVSQKRWVLVIVKLGNQADIRRKLIVKNAGLRQMIVAN
jgi:hypothetical protein